MPSSDEKWKQLRSKGPLWRQDGWCPPPPPSGDESAALWRHSPPTNGAILESMMLAWIRWSGGGGVRQWQFSATKRGGGLSDTRGGISRHKINFFLKGQLTALIFQWNEARNRFTEDIPASYFFFPHARFQREKRASAHLCCTLKVLADFGL